MAQKYPTLPNRHIIPEGEYLLRLIDYENRTSHSKGTPYIAATFRIENTEEGGYALHQAIFQRRSAERMAERCGIEPRSYDDAESIVRKCLGLTFTATVGIRHHEDRAFNEVRL